MESHEDSKIKILREFSVERCFKGGEIFLNNALIWTKILQFLTTNPWNTQAVNTVKCLKCKKSRSYTYKWENKLLREENIAKVAIMSRHFFSLKASCLPINTHVIYMYQFHYNLSD